MNRNSIRRYNILLDSWVITAANRVNRPWQGAQTGDAGSGFQKAEGINPLAPGGIRLNGQVTPDYLGAYVFDNDYPSMTDFDVLSETALDDPLFKQETIRGVCRVICYSHVPTNTLATMTENEVLGVIETWMEQYKELKDKFIWIQVILRQKNDEIFRYLKIVDRRSAAAILTPMLWAGDFLPTIPKKKDDTQKAYYIKYGRPMLCDYFDQEIIKKERVVLINDDWVVVVPYWATWPFETLLSCRRHVPNFDELTEEERSSLAKILRQLVIKYDNIFKCVFPYSMGWQFAPTGKMWGENRHWQLHAAFYPPLLRSATVPKYMAGYEVFAEPQRDITPEKAAEIIRSQPAKRFA